MKSVQQTAADLTLMREHRRGYRQALTIKGMLYLDSNAAGPQRVRLKNVSVGGVGFESQYPIGLGARCRLIIEMGPARLNWRVRIVCCGKMGEGGYYLGGQFVTNELERSGSADLDSSVSDSIHIRE